MVSRSKKGNVAVIWLLALVSVFVVALVYIVMTEPFNAIDQKLSPEINESYQPTVDKIRTIWTNWPILVIFAIILGAIVLTLKQRGSDPGYY